MIQEYLKWKEFNEQVRTLLTVDSARLGTEDKVVDGKTIPGFVTLQIRLALLDLQEFIPALCAGHETIYLPEDFATEGDANRAVLPPMAKVRDAWLFNLETGTRYPVIHRFPWERRFELIHGLHSVEDNQGRMAIDPRAYTFYVYPILGEDWILSIFWDGKKSQFRDEEETPFTEEVASAVAEYVKGKLAREIDEDMSKYNSFFHPTVGSYSIARRNLFHNAKERTSGVGGRSYSEITKGASMPQPRQIVQQTIVNNPNPIIVGDGNPNVDTLKNYDKTQPWLYKDRGTGGTWTWDVKNQVWI